MRVHEAGALHADIGQHGPAWLREPDDVNLLLPQLWPGSVVRGADGVLRVGGIPVTDLAAEYGTPAYVVDEADLRSRAAAYRTAFSAAFPAGADVYYAGKSFLCKAVVRWIAEEGLNLDVCSGGELAVALAAGFDPARIGFHGNNKSLAELDRAVSAGVGRIIVDSFDEIERLATLAADRGVRAPVMVRVTVGVEAHTHEYIATAHEDQKFGFSLNRGRAGREGGDAAEAVRRVLAAPSLRLLGLHSHIGSQIYDAQGFEVSARRVLGLQAQIRDEHGIEPPELDLGGGFGIAYTTQDDPFEPVEIATALAGIVQHECTAYGLSVPRISVEPGRSISGPAAFTLYEVGTVKDVELDGGAVRRYVSVDGGMSDNIRTALYDASYSCTLASRLSDAPPALSRVVGKHCESGDIVVRDEFLPSDLAPGDLIAVPGTGAYTRSMANNYNHVPRPGVVAVADGTARVIVRAETEDDLLRLDVG
ncbi:diaminopimelate decarboxylase [Actinocatenispora rupis]|uniref:Diaminopimelate decarboxylase n=1 Tax=Actinocatenispora rupis TaxID=519421 RepID=A0A8J3NEM2_9ACTN|nr:diaminopimelate decarboxylase [Actinocatenispora rupis]GID12749.1 diaminopimelate decarboxylase [Actinocatenispora rupis]